MAGVFVLATRKNYVSFGLEYRVAILNSEDELYDYDYINDVEIPNFSTLINYFGNSKVAKNESDAVDMAFELLNNIKSNEIQGLGIIYRFENYHFDQFLEKLNS